MLIGPFPVMLDSNASGPLECSMGIHSSDFLTFSHLKNVAVGDGESENWNSPQLISFDKYNAHKVRQVARKRPAKLGLSRSIREYLALFSRPMAASSVKL